MKPGTLAAVAPRNASPPPCAGPIPCGEVVTQRGRDAGGGCQTPPEARSWRFYAFSEPRGSVASWLRPSAFPTHRVCFTPETLLGFRLQGFAPPGDPGSSPSPLLPCGWTTSEDAVVGFGGFLPPDRRRTRSRSPPRAECPPGVLPSEVFPPAAVGPASRPLLSRASPIAGRRTVSDAAPSAWLRLRVLPCGERGLRFGQRKRRPPHHRPLWGSSPRRFHLHPSETTP